MAHETVARAKRTPGPRTPSTAPGDGWGSGTVCAILWPVEVGMLLAPGTAGNFVPGRGNAWPSRVCTAARLAPRGEAPAQRLVPGLSKLGRNQVRRLRLEVSHRDQAPGQLWHEQRVARVLWTEDAALDHLSIGRVFALRELARDQLERRQRGLCVRGLRSGGDRRAPAGNRSSTSVPCSATVARSRVQGRGSTEVRWFRT